jgi:uncharacterized protein
VKFLDNHFDLGVDCFDGNVAADSQGATTMTWDPERDDNSWDEDDFGGEPSPKIRHEQPPAIWPVFVALVGALVVGIGLQVVLIAGIVIFLLANGTKLQALGNDLIDAITSPGVFMVIAALSELGFAGAAVIGAWYSRQGLVNALGFGKPAVPLLALPVVIVGAMAPGVLGNVLASWVTQFLPHDTTFEQVFGRLTLTSAVPFVLFIGLAPGFAEEMFFRGYMQRRLSLGLSPWIAILITSALFGVVHLNPPQVVFAFLLGAWLGVIAWRTGSIWPGIVAHAAWNSMSVFWVVGERLLGFPEDPPLIPSIIVGVIVLGCFIASIWLLKRATPPGPDDGIPLAELAPD